MGQAIPTTITAGKLEQQQNWSLESCLQLLDTKTSIQWYRHIIINLVWFEAQVTNLAYRRLVEKGPRCTHNPGGIISDTKGGFFPFDSYTKTAA